MIAHQLRQVSPKAPAGAVAFRPWQEVLARYLTSAPLAHALFRAAEAAHLAALPLQRPILDLGCGRGEFASHALTAAVDAGVDLHRAHLQSARATARYASLWHADARQLPFAENTFRTILSVSVLEHVVEPAAVLAEVVRILQPGGYFIGTLVLVDLQEHLFWPRWWRRWRLPYLARAYQRFQDWFFQHRTLWPQASWEQLFRLQGLEIVISRKIVSPALTRCWDLLLPVAVLERLAQVIGISQLLHPAGLASWLGTRLVDFRETALPAGSCWLFAARKPSPRLASDTGLPAAARPAPPPGKEKESFFTDRKRE